MTYWSQFYSFIIFNTISLGSSNFKSTCYLLKHSVFFYYDAYCQYQKSHLIANILKVSKGIKIKIGNRNRTKRDDYSPRGKGVPAPGWVLTEADKTEVTQGKWQVERKSFISYSANQAPVYLTPPARVGACLPRPPLLGGTSWAGPWWLTNTRPITYQEWRERDNSCLLSTPCPGSTGGSSVVKHSLICK